MGTELIEFTDHPFHKLTLDEWYGISSLRERVFVVEQNCPYLDADGKDLNAYHIIGRDFQGQILAYARIVHPLDQKLPWSKVEYLAQSMNERYILQYQNNKSGLYLPAIGRVVLDKSLRGKGWGDRLMEYTLSCYLRIFENKIVFISAQKALLGFYTQHGFVQSGLGYLEDGIPHIPMVFGFDL